MPKRIKMGIVRSDCKHDQNHSISYSSGFYWITCDICGLKRYQIRDEKEAKEKQKEINRKNLKNLEF